MLTMLDGYSVLKSSSVMSVDGVWYRYFLVIKNGAEHQYRVLREEFNTKSYVSSSIVLCDTDDLLKANVIFEREL